MEDPFQLAAKIKLEFSAPTQVLVLVSAYHEPQMQEMVQATVIEKIIYYPISQTEKFIGLRHASILLVEDNEINQEVAKAILMDMGMRIDIADNGMKAVE
ncbi:response regulator [Paenibacillus cremeus]|uniref:Response regulator n=1 Tax=Paenibacillus cremeus TaxID=2163881 RepID=A0A559KG99_9BACL|nr:response regulator [Paenibacillus cremeus]TVY11153.1 response regulator [Paenibacillus cremeus]